uniref:Uncharacterized protein n=1 Tax=Acrobeloides nanus TaxID=290746 RepID=A0A914DWW7_9BILA
MINSNEAQLHQNMKKSTSSLDTNMQIGDSVKMKPAKNKRQITSSLTAARKVKMAKTQARNELEFKEDDMELKTEQLEEKEEELQEKEDDLKAKEVGFGNARN